MSMQTYTNNGYGFKVSDLEKNISFSILKAFADKTEKTKSNFRDMLYDYYIDRDDCEELEEFDCYYDNIEKADESFMISDFLDYYNDEASWNDRAIESLVAESVEDRYDIYLDNVWDEDSDEYYLLFLPQYPWQMSDAERKLTSEDLEKILAEIYKDFTGEDYKLEDYQTSYCG